MTIKATSRILLAIAALVCTPAMVSSTSDAGREEDRPGCDDRNRSSQLPRVAGSSVQFDAQVTGIAVAAPTGSLIYTVTSLGSEPVLTGTAPIVGGLSTWTAYARAEGYTVSVSYPGDVNYLPLSASLPAGPRKTLTLPSPP